MGCNDPTSPCEGLFACTLCGECCKGYGGTYLSSADILAISRYIGVSKDRLVASYTRKSGDKLLISQADTGYCIFWDKVCTIHPVKPKMCRQWPFIPAILADVGNWRAMAGSCPGMDAGAPDQKIIDCVKKALKA
ncbi:zinc/iron-chelating domain-containing protein [Desulfosarcina alkanivorans]|uniref:Zinc/iron-chelating domain-containing protein n=1 Tax=Desulfosarcina alkanivorans TaxID=571177 RepID=A0A5K7YUS0_9BACT|nr:YkgJ family cysteine cluster protein [Desulfosarcina alkanivorans]BBO72408.1 zinc/iron-chelating domain-containing protein [Desulfosarcina alkanivorans]